MPEDSTVDDMRIDVWCQRAKRKNRVAQLKRTIARMTAENRDFRSLRLGKHLKDFSAEWEAFMLLCKLKTPAKGAELEEQLDYWLTLRKVCTLALDAACLAAIAYREAKATAKNGQQTARKGEA